MGATSNQGVIFPEPRVPINSPGEMGSAPQVLLLMTLLGECA